MAAEKPKRGNPNWRKGGPSPNPGGRPKKVSELLELFRSESPDSLELAKALRDDVEADDRVRLEAAKLILAYGLGAPPKSSVVIEEDDDVQTSAAPDLETSRRIVKLALVKTKKRKDEPDE